MKQIKEQFLSAIKKSFAAYNKKGGARSTKKLVPIHKFLSQVVFDEIGDDFLIKSLGIGNGKEVKINGKYYEKDLDVAIIKSNKIIATISFKFVTSNYKQNANNYFENLMGEAANIRRQNVGFAHLLVLRGHTPYFSKNKGNLRGRKMKTEIINEKDLQKYVKLLSDMDFPHRPDLIGICLLDFAKNDPFFVDFDKFDFSDGTKKMLEDDFSLEKFFEKFIHLVKLKS